jgi:hypothetical protein
VRFRHSCKGRIEGHERQVSGRPGGLQDQAVREIDPRNSPEVLEGLRDDSLILEMKVRVDITASTH